MNLTDRREFHPLMLRAAARLIRREERFAKTAVGWAFRELGKREPAVVAGFVEEHRASFSREALGNALKGLPAADRARLTRTGPGPRPPRRCPSPSRTQRGARR